MWMDDGFDPMTRIPIFSFPVTMSEPKNGSISDHSERRDILRRQQAVTSFAGGDSALSRSLESADLSGNCY